MKKKGPVETKKSTLTPDQRFYIPVSIRKEMNIKTGDTLEVFVKAGKIQFKKITDESQ